MILLLCGAFPVKFALALHLGKPNGFGAGFSLFSARRSLRSARERALGKKKNWKWKRPSKPPDPARLLPAAAHAGIYLLRRVRIPAFCIRGSISLPDAAHTALICGALQAAGGIIPSANIQLQPDFSAGSSDALISCIISLRIGHIIFAVLKGAWHYLARRKAHGKASD